jgi:subtilisin family serine protease
MPNQVATFDAAGMPDEIVYRLPPFRLEVVFAALAETIDWHLSAYGIPEAWKTSRGRGIRVAVLDTGIDAAHPDLAGTLLEGRDFTGSASGCADRVGHGTHVAGLIAARQDDRGVVGICPGLAEDGGGLLVAKVLADDAGGLDSWIAAGVDWAVERGAHLVSMSLGSPQPGTSLYQTIRRATAAGVFVICAAGNHGSDDSVDYPARWPEAIAVAAVDRHGRAAPFSSRGPEVDVAAPGQDILSTYPGARYAKLSGTSMATPFVTGVVALMLAKHRQLESHTPVKTVDQLREHLARTADDAGSPGKDPAYGHGLINPRSMLAAPPGELPIWTGLRWNVEIGGTPAAFVLVPRDSQVVIHGPQVAGTLRVP